MSTRRIAPVRLERLQHAEADVDDVAGLDGGVGAQAARAIQLGDRVAGAGPLRDELLLVDEAHHAQVLAADAGLALLPIGKRRLARSALEVGQARIAPGESRARTNAAIRARTAAARRGSISAAVQECVAALGIEALDQRLRAQRRLDRRQRGEVRRLQQVEDEMIEVALAHAAQVVGMRLARRTASKEAAVTPRASSVVRSGARSAQVIVWPLREPARVRRQVRAPRPGPGQASLFERRTGEMRAGDEKNSGPRSENLEPRTWSSSLGSLDPKAGTVRTRSRNPSWTKRWKFDWPVVLRLMRPKSAEVVSGCSCARRTSGC